VVVGVADLTARIHQRRKLIDHLAVPDSDSSDLDDTLRDRVKPSRLHVDHDKVDTSDVGPTVAGQHGRSYTGAHRRANRA
jgi:hypothetical protein